MWKNKRKLRVGDWIEVRSKEEILSTLDSNGRLDGMPFMPEMFPFCGKKFQVYKRAHKTCDPVFSIRGRRLERAVHLATRCDGSAHGGCQAGCLIFWKESWLKRVDATSRSEALAAPPPLSQPVHVASGAACNESQIWDRAQVPDPNGEAPAYMCQTTELPNATTQLAWWDIRQYIEDYMSGNVGLRRLLGGFVYSMYYNLSQAGIGAGPLLRWFYDRFHPLWRGTRFPRNSGTIPKGQPTPRLALDLEPGELVHVKSHEEILRTVSAEGKNRGMYWDAEMVPYCGGTYRVLRRVTKIIDEKTGRIQEIRNPCVILDNVVCQSRYSGCRMFCPRSLYSYWREIWLERVEPASSDTGELNQ